MQEKRDGLKFQAQLTEWQTKNLAMMFQVAAREDKQARAIVKVVKGMSLPLSDEEEEADIIDDRDYETEVITAGAKVDLESQPSFEALEAALQHI